MAFFETIEKSHPDSALGVLGRALVHETRMLENGTFSKEKEFTAAAEASASMLEKALDEPGQDVWDRMLAGGFYGIRGLHAMRKKKYLAALNDGWDGLSMMKQLKTEAPGLADTDLGLGAYDYYGSQMTRNVSRLPFFPDKRKQGIAAMERALVEAQIVRPVVQLVLVYTYIDERRYDDAITLDEDLALRYPNSTLVRVQLGRAWSRKGRYSRALDAFREVERLQPDHKLIRYYLGANLMYEGKDLDTAEAHLRAFIADPPGDEWRGWAHEHLGDLYQKRKQPDMALVFWKRALRDSPDDEAVRKKIDRARKKGAVPAKGVPEITPVPKPTP